MSHRSTRPFSPTRFAVSVCVSTTLLTSVCAQPVSDWAAAVESDWLSPAAVGRYSGVTKPLPTPEGDAIGGCDGIINGQYGFHTDITERPWWQVDLLQSEAVSRVVIYNRCDWPDRPGKLTILLSDNGSDWRQVYQHGGTGFKGYSDGKPLIANLDGSKARYVRVQLPGSEYLHLDEVQVYGGDTCKNLALNKPATQSSVSPWSVSRSLIANYPVTEVIARGRKLAEDLKTHGVDVREALRQFEKIEEAAAGASPSAMQSLYTRARQVVRGLVFSNPLIDFDKLLFVKRAPGIYSHMSDQNYGWWSRPGGGLFILEGLKGGEPKLTCLTGSFPEGSVNCPDLSYNAKKVLFAYCRYYPGLATLDKYDNSKLPEDSFYHIYEMNIDGTGLRQLTHGRYDDTFPRYLPNGEIVFLSTRRGQALQCGDESAMATLTADLPDSYVRCGGDVRRPVAIYTLHTMTSDGSRVRAISAFESFEWTPMVDEDGKITYARWDYVDRTNMPYMKLWSTRPDGTNPRIVWGNYTTNPHCIFDACRIPGTQKYIAIASAHHSITGGSLVLLDPAKAMEGLDAITRLSPEVCFPETEGWPSSYFTNPYPLSTDYYLVSWSNTDLIREAGTNPTNALGIYVYDSSGNLELIYRDPAISSMFPIPIRPRKVAANYSSEIDWNGPQQGTIMLADVYKGLTGVAKGTIESLRIVAMPVKTQPWMNSPNLGITADDPGKCVLGTVPVEADGSASFTVPSGVSVFFQALDNKGKAVQTMRSLTYVQPGEKLSCVGCHESRTTAPPAATSMPVAFTRSPSKIKPGPVGSWPLRFDKLVQPILDKHCVSCHSPAGNNTEAGSIDLTAAKSYETLINAGKPNLREMIWNVYNRGYSIVGDGPSHTSPIMAMLEQGHGKVKLSPDETLRLITWMDTYAQRQGHFSPEQEKHLEDLKLKWTGLLAK